MIIAACIVFIALLILGIKYGECEFFSFRAIELAGIALGLWLSTRVAKAISEKVGFSMKRREHILMILDQLLSLISEINESLDSSGAYKPPADNDPSSNRILSQLQFALTLSEILQSQCRHNEFAFLRSQDNRKIRDKILEYKIEITGSGTSRVQRTVIFHGIITEVFNARAKIITEII